ncbi:MAG: Rab family GTPase [Candidatus Heimdallarchaeota archaeon]
MDPDQGKSFKIALLGEAGVGKTTLARAFIEDSSQSLGAQRPTLGVDIRRKEISIFLEKNPSRELVAIWDLSGQPTFRSLVSQALQGAGAAIVVYDIGRYETFQAAASWLDFLWKAEPANIKKPIVLVGNKRDVRRKKLGKVTPGQGKDYAIQISRYTGIETPFHETAAIIRDNVSAPFRDAVKLLLQQLKKA